VRTNEFRVTNDGGIELDLYRLGMVGFSGTDVVIGRIFEIGIATGVTNGSVEYSFVLRWRVVLEKDVLDAPEASCSEGSDFGFEI